jgi:hypothetical protein
MCKGFTQEIEQQQQQKLSAYQNGSLIGEENPIS